MCIHFPAFAAMMYWHIETWPKPLFYFCSFVIGYTDLFILAFVLALGYRTMRKLITAARS